MNLVHINSFWIVDLVKIDVLNLKIVVYLNIVSKFWLVRGHN